MCFFSKQVLAAEFLTSSNDPGAMNELRNALNGLAFKCHWNLDKKGPYGIILLFNTY